MTQTKINNKAYLAMQMAKGASARNRNETQDGALQSVDAVKSLPDGALSSADTPNATLTTLSTTPSTTMPNYTTNTPSAPQLVTQTNQAAQNDLTNQPPPNKTAASADQPIKTPIKNARVDLSIAGTPIRISCPTDEVESLNRCADDLNEALRELRRQMGGRKPSNEELLILHILELNDQLKDAKSRLHAHEQERARAQTMLAKLIDETQATLALDGTKIQ